METPLISSGRAANVWRLPAILLISALVLVGYYSFRHEKTELQVGNAIELPVSEPDADDELLILCFHWDHAPERWLEGLCNWVQVENAGKAGVTVVKNPWSALNTVLDRRQPGTAKKFIIFLAGHGSDGRRHDGSLRPSSNIEIGRRTYASLFRLIKKFRTHNKVSGETAVVTNACFGQYLTIQDEYVSDPFPIITVWGFKSGLSKTYSIGATPDTKFPYYNSVNDLVQGDIGFEEGQIPEIAAIVPTTEIVKGVTVRKDPIWFMRQAVTRMVGGRREKSMLFSSGRVRASGKYDFVWVSPNPQRTLSWNINPQYFMITFAHSFNQARCTRKLSATYNIDGLDRFGVDSDPELAATKMYPAGTALWVPVKKPVTGATVTRVSAGKYTITFTWDATSCVPNMDIIVFKARWEIRKFLQIRSVAEAQADMAIKNKADDTQRVKKRFSETMALMKKAAEERRSQGNVPNQSLVPRVQGSGNLGPLKLSKGQEVKMKFYDKAIILDWVEDQAKYRAQIGTVNFMVSVGNIILDSAPQSRAPVPKVQKTQQIQIETPRTINRLQRTQSVVPEVPKVQTQTGSLGPLSLNKGQQVVYNGDKATIEDWLPVKGKYLARMGEVLFEASAGKIVVR